MAEEVTQTQSTEPASSTQDPQQSAPQTGASTAQTSGAPQTLEDVYKSFNVSATPQQHAPQPVPQVYQPQPMPQPQVSIPDPALDPQGFQRHEMQRMQEQNVLRHALTGLAGQLGQFQRAQARQIEEQDIKQAVGVVKDKVPGLDDDMIEVALGAKARRDTRLAQLWNTRAQNPQAWNAALNAFANELAGKHQAAVDPQLLENQRAVKAAQQSTAATGRTDDINDRLGKLQGAAFDRAMDNIRQGRSPF